MAEKVTCPKCNYYFDPDGLERAIEINVNTTEISIAAIETRNIYVNCPVCGEKVLIKSLKEIIKKDNGGHTMDPCTEAICKANIENNPRRVELKEEEVSNPVLKIRYHREAYPELPDVEQHGNFIDLYCAETVSLNKGDFHMIDLGISVECPDGYWMQIVPRSSTFKNWGILQVNSFGVLDTEYCGDNDIVKLPVYATRDIIIPANTRICQFRLVKDNPIDIITVEKLEGPDRGGFGSTGNYQKEG